MTFKFHVSGTGDISAGKRGVHAGSIMKAGKGIHSQRAFIHITDVAFPSFKIGFQDIVNPVLVPGQQLLLFIFQEMLHIFKVVFRDHIQQGILERSLFFVAGVFL